MKKYLYILLTAGTIASLTSCDRLLDNNRFPLDTTTNTPEFWNNTTNVQGEVNGLYNYYYGYGNAAGRNGTFYFESLNDDQVGNIANGGGTFYEWYDLTVPSTQSTWDTNYIIIRRCNYIIQGVTASGNTLNESVRNNFIGLARANRARAYYHLVQHFGDVPLVLTVLDPSDEAELYGPRTNRETVMDQVLQDLDFAIANISAVGAENSPLEFSQDMAKALKAEICLYEASYAKYHSNNSARATQFYNEVVSAATPLLSKYGFCSNYKSLYNSSYSGEDGTALLQNNPEIIFMKAYIRGALANSISKYTATATLICGLTKDAFDSYLFVDGKPLASTTENTSDMGYMDETGLCIQDLLDVRDQRLAAVIDPYVNFNGNVDNLVYIRNNSEAFTSSTGYSVSKFYNPLMNTTSATLDGQGYLAAPLFWKSKVALEFAEAKAELGTLTDADLNISLNPLYERAGLPAQTVSSLSTINDPANNMGVSSLIWEVRRCRRAELMFDGYRYWDLVRWHQLEIMDTNNYPNVNLGANITPALADYPAQNVNGYFNYYPNNSRTYNSKYYLWPIGQAQINLNPNLTQNPGWN